MKTLKILTKDCKTIYLNKTELCKIGTFPADYDFSNVAPNYLIGMSVPPVMTANISYEIYKQWLSKL